MSRVAKAPIELPAKVELSIGRESITVSGPKGSLTQAYSRLVSISKAESDTNVITFNPASKDPKAWAQAGTVRALVQNMINGVTHGYTRQLDLVGVGFRAQAKGHSLSLSLGYSHNIEYHLPKGVTAETPSNTTIILHSIDKQLLGQTAAEIRSYRRPEPYKGKGVKYANEHIVRKEAKKK